MGVTMRRKVADEEFRRAWSGTPGDRASEEEAASNRAIVTAILREYRNQLDEHELDSCGMNAMYRCMQYHREEFGQKFTTSLHRFVRWECNRELRKKKRRAGNVVTGVPISEPVGDTLVYGDNETHIRECMALLPADQADILRLRFYEGLSIQQIADRIGWAKETARQRLMDAVSAIRDVYQSDVGESVGVILSGTY